MIKHVILWKLKDEYTAEEKAHCVSEIKSRLEALNGKIDGMIRLTVNAGALSSSSADVMLDSEFESAEALAGYQTNPLHLEAAGYVRSVVGQRLCLDFEA